MSLAFRHSIVSIAPGEWSAFTWLTANGNSEFMLGEGVANSPGAALERAENAARLALENVLGLWGKKAEADEIAR